MFELFDPGEEFNVTTGANLPHWHQSGVTYFVTFRTDDSIPVEVVTRWHAERATWLANEGTSIKDSNWKSQLAQLGWSARRQFHETFSKSFMENLDKGFGECVLRAPELAKIVADALMYFDGHRYEMGDFVVMPNHVHLLVCLTGTTNILDQCYSWKSFTAKQINRLLGRRGRFWQEESFDHLVRSTNQFEAIQRYIKANPRYLSDGEFYLRSLL